MPFMLAPSPASKPPTLGGAPPALDGGPDDNPSGVSPLPSNPPRPASPLTPAAPDRAERPCARRAAACAPSAATPSADALEFGDESSGDARKLDRFALVDFCAAAAAILQRRKMKQPIHASKRALVGKHENAADAVNGICAQRTVSNGLRAGCSPLNASVALVLIVRPGTGVVLGEGRSLNDAFVELAAFASPLTPAINKLAIRETWLEGTLEVEHSLH